MGIVVNGYAVKKGEKFRYGADVYVATGDAYGEFNAYIPVDRGGEIVVAHGNQVEILPNG